MMNAYDLTALQHSAYYLHSICLKILLQFLLICNLTTSLMSNYLHKQERHSYSYFKTNIMQRKGLRWSL